MIGVTVAQHLHAAITAGEVFDSALEALGHVFIVYSIDAEVNIRYALAVLQ